MMTNDEILNSWKEVATYMGRGVRTVQRWEQELGLPVRRPRGKSRSAVIAFKSELDQWLHRAPGELMQPSEPAPEPAIIRDSFPRSEPQARLHDSTALMMSKTQVLISRSSDLCARLENLRLQIERTVRLANQNVEQKTKPFKVDAIRKPAITDTAALKGVPEEPLRKNHALAS